MSHPARPLLLFVAFFLIHGAREVASAQGVRVSVKFQPDAPLLLGVLFVEATDPRSPAFQYSLTNRGDKPIRAYALSIKDGGLSGWMRSLRTFPLQPGAIEFERYGDRTSNEPVEAIQLSLDFVAFTDGSLWGPDAGKAGEWLNAMRDGMEFGRDQLLKAITAGGTSAMMDLLIAELPSFKAPEGRSERWQRDFQMGAKHFWMRMQKLAREGGIRAAESELQRPFYLRD